MTELIWLLFVVNKFESIIIYQFIKFILSVINLIYVVFNPFQKVRETFIKLVTKLSSEDSQNHIFEVYCVERKFILLEKLNRLLY